MERGNRQKLSRKFPAIQYVLITSYLTKVWLVGYFLLEIWVKWMHWGITISHNNKKGLLSNLGLTCNLKIWMYRNTRDYTMLLTQIHIVLQVYCTSMAIYYFVSNFLGFKISDFGDSKVFCDLKSSPAHNLKICKQISHFL